MKNNQLASQNSFFGFGHFHFERQFQIQKLLVIPRKDGRQAFQEFGGIQFFLDLQILRANPEYWH